MMGYGFGVKVYTLSGLLLIEHSSGSIVSAHENVEKAKEYSLAHFIKLVDYNGENEVVIGKWIGNKIQGWIKK